MGTAVLMRRSLDYCWRLIATAISFSAFGLGGLLLWTCVFPLVRLLAGRRQAVLTRWIIQKSFAAFLRFMIVLGVMRLQVEGEEKLRRCAGVLVLANHPTLIDVVALVSLMPAASCVVKQALWRNPFLGGVVRAAGYISNSDSDRLIGDCVADLHAGRPLLIFPEGTRTQPGQPRVFQRGAAYIALRGGRPILPVLIDCQPPTLTKRDRWYQIPPRRFCLRIRVLDETSVGRLVEPSSVPAIAARQLTQALEGFFSRELIRWTC